jgi:hypothetical protein
LSFGIHGDGFQIPCLVLMDTKVCECSSHLYKMVWHLHVTYILLYTLNHV